MIGETINNYRVTGLLGEGGMGSVYVAEHPFIGRKAAIKVLKKELCQEKHLVDRFMNEARAANAVGHPNIIDVIDVGLLPSGVPYLMMEYLDGESVARRLARARPSVAEAVEIAAQTASALDAAHRKGIVHRDLKPDNLYLVGNGAIRVKVLDFGIAKLREDMSGGGTRTRDGSIMGTPPYMSPEQCRGIMSAIDHRTDVYAMGIILYEMLAGAPPFVSDGWGDLLIMHVTTPPPPLLPRNPAVSIELEHIIMKALAKAREERWTSMAELEAALRALAPSPAARGPSRATELLPTPARAAPPTTMRAATGQVATSEEPLAAAPGGRRRGLVAGGLVVAAGAAIAVFALRPARENAPEKPGVAERAAAASSPRPAPAVPAPVPAAAAPVPAVVARVPAAVAPVPAALAPAAASSGPAPAAPSPPARAPSSGDKRAHTTRSRHRSVPTSVSSAAPGEAAAPPSAPAPAPPPAPPQDSPLKRGVNNAPIIR
ncbi:MAG TPA: serine/threonine-protein kinase [Polyangia bacterium]|nr:serine/threonine-protein kinase [Polyangia bacterium]